MNVALNSLWWGDAIPRHSSSWELAEVMLLAWRHRAVSWPNIDLSSTATVAITWKYFFQDALMKSICMLCHEITFYCWTGTYISHQTSRVNWLSGGRVVPSNPTGLVISLVISFSSLHWILCRFVMIVTITTVEKRWMLWTILKRMGLHADCRTDRHGGQWSLSFSAAKKWWRHDMEIPYMLLALCDH